MAVIVQGGVVGVAPTEFAFFISLVVFLLPVDLTNQKLLDSHPASSSRNFEVWLLYLFI